MSPSTETFFNCVAGAILMTWCEWLGGNVTSSSWYLLAAFDCEAD